MATSRGPIPDLPGSVNRRAFSGCPRHRAWVRQPGPSRDQAASRPSDVKSCRDTTGHNGTKPAGRHDQPSNYCWPADQVMKNQASPESIRTATHMSTPRTPQRVRLRPDASCPFCLAARGPSVADAATDEPPELHQLVHQRLRTTEDILGPNPKMRPDYGRTRTSRWVLLPTTEASEG
jgi:hypothetical protein